MWDDLICPFDHGTLEGWGSWLSCRRCGRGYPVIDSIPTFLPCDEDQVWRERQSMLGASMLEAPRTTEHAWSSSIRERGRALEARLKKHLMLGPRSRILQIGLRGQGEIHHFSCGIRYGIDPLAGVMAAQGMLKWGQVRWASSCGEALPFPTANFQVILLSDILGSVESPERVLDEARRCLRRDGVLVVSLPSRWDGQRKSRLLRGGSRKIKPLRRVNRGRTLKWCQQAGFETVWSGDAMKTPAENSAGSTIAQSRMAAPCLILRLPPEPVATVAGASAASEAALSTTRQLAD